MKRLLTIVRCLIRGHDWTPEAGTPWAELRVCATCGRVEQRSVRGNLVFPWRRLRCERRSPAAHV
jgi:hypothetical protein